MGAECGGPVPPPFEPVVDTKLLIESVVDPTPTRLNAIVNANK